MEDYRVWLTQSAMQDLKDIASYLAQERREPSAAQTLVKKIKTAVMSLARFPLRHNLVADEHLAAQGFRKIPIDNYLVFYLVSEREQTVTVVRILYGRRDWIHWL